MPTNKNESKVAEPLAPGQIRARLMEAGIDYAEIARRVKKRTRRACPIENISRVVQRTHGFSFPVIREVIAEAINEPVERIGREATRKSVKKTAAKARSVSKALAV